ncbi:hypothetical protein [Rouxiella sp. WC2420]|uniref:Glycosyltransferase RgtA/B/C/D-like domain-containing protein n=1 Tax=Rouxiella sp. WC2420 TaxID=3234145 RepID=A0AB39VJI0_9GAMM
MQNRQVSRVFILILWVTIIFLSGSTFALNNADYARTTDTFMAHIPFMNPYIPLAWQMKVHFQPIGQLFEFSVYSIMLYLYASIISLLTSWFDLMLMASMLKFIYLLELFALSKIFFDYSRKSHYFIFTLFIIPLFSSSILSFIASFYQDSIVVFTLPILCYVLCKPVKYSAGVLFLLASAIACTKTQYFYLPLVILVGLWVFNEKVDKKKYIALFLSFVMALIVVSHSNKTVPLNKYNSNYFGAYLYQTLNHIELDSSVEAECVGIDPWNQKYDFNLGSVVNPKPKIGCYARHHSDASFSKSFAVFFKRPANLLTLPFDPSIQRQMKEEYFSLAYANKYFSSHDRFISKVTELKDDIYGPWRYSIAVLIVLLSFFLKSNPQAKLMFILGVFSSSQLYIAFFGEGYRDMSRHLFAMNFSFDLLIFICMMMLAQALFKRWQNRAVVSIK